MSILTEGDIKACWGRNFQYSITTIAKRLIGLEHTPIRRSVAELHDLANVCWLLHLAVVIAYLCIARTLESKESR